MPTSRPAPPHDRVCALSARTQGPDPQKNRVLAIGNEPNTLWTCGFVVVLWTWVVPSDPQFQAEFLAAPLP